MQVIIADHNQIKLIIFWERDSNNISHQNLSKTELVILHGNSTD